MLLKRSILILVSLSWWLSAAAAVELFREDFSNPDAARRRFTLEHGAPASFRLADQTLLLGLDEKGAGSRLRLNGIVGLQDFELEFSLRFAAGATGGFAGVVLRRPDWKSPGLGISLLSGEGHLLIQAPPEFKADYTLLTLEKGIRHRVKIVAVGEKVRIEVDGKTVLDLANLPAVAGDICLRTWQTTAEFDDLVIRPAAVGAVAMRNLVVNGGFEHAGAPNLPAAWGMAAWGLVDDHWIGAMSELWERWRRDLENPYEGKYCMRVDGVNILASCLFPVQADTDYTMSAQVRSDRDGRSMKLRYVAWRGKVAEKEFSLGTEWQRITWQLPRNTASQAGVYFYGPEDGVLWVDAVMVTQGTVAPATYLADEFDPAPSPGHAADVPKIAAGRLDRAPELDGLLADPAWRQAAPFELKTANGGIPRQKTDGFIGYDDKHLYIGMRCFDSQMDRLAAAAAARDDHVWRDDCVEIFLGPSGPRGDWADYFHLGLSVTGAQYDARKADPAWNAAWTAKTARFPDRWEAVMAIPFASLELSAFTRGDWTVNFCRENPKLQEFSAWSPTQGTFHTAERFGILAALPSEITAPYAAPATGGDDNTGHPDPVVAPKVAGQPFFSFGVSWQSTVLPGENIFRELKRSGMNTLTWAIRVREFSETQVRQVLDFAHRHGIRVVPWFDYAFDRGGVQYADCPGLAEATVNRYKDHPAILAWMVLDEPHDHAEAVKATVAAAQAADPSRPVFINVTPHGLGMRVGGLPGDILAVDRYVFRFDGSRLADLDVMLAAAAREARSRPRPVFAFLQGMSNALWVWRGPGPDEMTAQTYLAVVHGVTGIWYFNAVILPVDTWERAGELGVELQTLLPRLLATEIPAVACSSPDLRFIARSDGRIITLAAVNFRERPVTAEFTFAQPVRRVGELFGKGEVKTAGNRLDVVFKPLERRVFEIELGIGEQ